MGKLNVHYFGQYHTGVLNLKISCRTMNGVKAYGLDASEKIEGFTWDKNDRVWFSVFADDKDLIKAICKCSEKMRETEDDRWSPTLGIEDGIKSQAALDKWFQENSQSVSVL